VAIAGCMAMDVISILRKKRQAVTGYDIAISGERRTEHPKAYTRIEIVHRVSGRDVSLKAVEEAVELSRTKYCSVQSSIHPGSPSATAAKCCRREPAAGAAGTAAPTGAGFPSFPSREGQAHGGVSNREGQPRRDEGAG